MSSNFGIIDKHIDDIKKYINKNKLSTHEFAELRKNLKKELKIESDLLDEILSRLFKHKYVLNNKLNFDNGQNCFRD